MTRGKYRKRCQKCRKMFNAKKKYYNKCLKCQHDEDIAIASLGK